MKDVAKAACVSQPAVSYAYNRPDQLSAEMPRHILLAAAELNYLRPDPDGRVLRSGRAGGVGLMITDSLPYTFADPATVELLRGIAEVGEMAEVMLTLSPLRSAAVSEDPTQVEVKEAALSSREGIDQKSIDNALVEVGGFNDNASSRAVQLLLDTYPDLSAVLASTDVLALETLAALKDRGMDVPGRLSGIGFDDVPAATAADLTTIAQPLIDKGRQAASLLFAASPQARPKRVILPTQLTHRGSTGPAHGLKR